MTKIYIIKDEEGNALYVGKTTQSLNKRLKQHMNQDNEKGYYLCNHKCTIEALDDTEGTGEHLEQYYINQYFPHFNKVNTNYIAGKQALHDQAKEAKQNALKRINKMKKRKNGSDK